MGLQATRDHYSRFYNGFTMWLHSFISAFFVIQRVGGTLTPSGSVSIDCGGQQTFTCAVPGTTAGWTITGLTGIAATTSTAAVLAGPSARLTTPDPTQAPTSTITITGFNTSDNGGTVQCVDISGVPSAEGVATIAVGVPSCPANVSVTDRSSDFSSATITWDQPINSPPVISYDVTCNSSCTAMPCTSGSSTCRVLSVSPCEDYSVTVLPMNSCGSSTGCTDNSVVVLSQGIPETCPNNVTATTHDDNDAVTVTWSLPPTSPPVTSTTVTYCPASSPNCGGSQVCTSPCTVRGLIPNTEYRFTVTPANNCGSPSCTGSTATAKTACSCSVASASVTPVILSGVIPSVALILINIITAVAVFLVTRHCYKKTAKGGSSSRREELYEQVEGKKMHEDINMIDSPAYGQVK